MVLLSRDVSGNNLKVVRPVRRETGCAAAGHVPELGDSAEISGVLALPRPIGYRPVMHTHKIEV
jgi:hypothetical protein